MKILRMTAPVVTAESSQLDATVAFYEGLLGERSRARLRNPAGTLDLVLIGSALVIGGSIEALASRRDLKATLIVDSLEEWKSELTRLGAAVIEEPTSGPISSAGAIGRYMFVRHPDGSVFEYFQPSA